MATPSTSTRWGPTANAEAVQAWDGPLFDRWLRFRHIVTDGLAVHGDRAMELLDPQPGENVLDIGCGLGDTTQRLAQLVGPDGQVVGIDAAPRFIEAARAEGRAPNTHFEVVDPQETTFEPRYDVAFSRMGTMFFTNPVAALRNIRGALVPGGRLGMAVWRQKIANDWVHRAESVVEAIVPRPEEYDEPTCGPGPFSMANADTVSDILGAAGYTDVALHRCDAPILMGRDVEEAIDLVTSIGPAGEILRLQGERAAHLHDRVRAALRDAFAELTSPDGVRAAASTWIVTARNPG